MSALLTKSPSVTDPPRKLWTRAEFEALASSGELQDQRLEMVEGELISKMGQNPPHVIFLALLADWCRAVFGARFVLQDSPIDVSPEDNPTSLPEPDVIVLARDRFDFATRRPRPEDLRLIIEVADTSIAFDIAAKARLYARAGIAEYWVFDVNERRMIVHREPRRGRYQSVVAYDSDQTIAPLSSPQSVLRIGHVLAPPR